MNSTDNESEKDAEDDTTEEAEEDEKTGFWFRWATGEQVEEQVHLEGHVCFAFACELMILSCVMLLTSFVGMVCK